MLRLLIALCFCGVSFSLHALEKIPLRVAAIDWCPQLCPEQKAGGYVLDLVQEIFADSPYQLEVSTYPWSRALTMTRQGRVDAVLSPARAEAPDLRYPNHEIGIQRMCFFTRADSQWRYTGVDSLKGLQFGLATDTSLEELNDYAMAHPNQFQYQPYHERYIVQQARKLDRARIDAFLFTYNSTLFELQRVNKHKQYRNAGCVSTAFIYMAFSPAREVSPRIEAMIRVFDQGMARLKQTNAIAPIMHHYGLEDWRQLLP